MHSFALKQSLKSMNLSTRHFVDPPNTGIRWVILGLRGERARARALERERERERESLSISGAAGRHRPNNSYNKNNSNSNSWETDARVNRRFRVDRDETLMACCLSVCVAAAVLASQQAAAVAASVISPFPPK